MSDNNLDALEIELKDFLSIDNYIDNLDISEKDKELKKIFLERCERDDNGRFVVSALWNDDAIDRLPNNYNLAYKILKSTTEKLNKNQIEQYDDVIKQQIQDGVVELINNNVHDFKDEKISFLAHKAVYRENNQSTKCRIVYLSNLAEKGKGNNLSHNQVSFPGPNMNPKLLIALTLLRFNKYLFIFDLVKAFHQLSISGFDSDKLHFLWYRNVKENDKTVVAYRIVRVPFGMRFSPFLLMMSLYVILILHARIVTEKESNVRSMLFNLSYMDNLAFSSNSENDLQHAFEKSFQIFNDACFNLQQFHSNYEPLLKENLPDEDTPEECKVLGMLWNVTTDSLYNKDTKLDPCAGTKREVLSTLNGIFDPLGLLLPTLNRAKLFLHSLHNRTSNWDESLNETETREWQLIYKQFNSSKPPKVSRYMGDYVQNYDLIAYCDASKDFYGCVLYLRACNSTDLKFVLARNRLVTKSQQSKSIPVLELFSMEFAVSSAIDLYLELINAFKPINIVNVHVHCDSMISLNWLVSKVSKFDKIERKGSVINNKLNSIVKLCNVFPVSFYHVCGLDNPADKVTRCVSATVLSRSNFLGGSELIRTGIAYIAVPLGKDTYEYCCNTVERHLATEPLISFDKFSSFEKLCRVFHYVRKFISNLKGRINYSAVRPECSYVDSKLLLIRQAQEMSFPEELAALHNKDLSKQSSNLITQLNLFLCPSGLIRVRGKIRNSDSMRNFKFPILLHKNSLLTHLIISDYHIKIKHVGIYKLLHLVQNEFWIPSALQTIKSIVNKCIVCKKLNGRTVKLNQNYYREYRINPEQIPFREIAIDHIGPFNVKIEGMCRKVYILIITCFFTRAVNLILCRNIDNRSFIMSFQEHIFLHGLPSRIISDNGSPIVSSINIISKLFDSVELRNFLIEKNISNFKFEPYPAQASHLGGIVESLVKHVKNMIYSTIGKNILSIEEFALLTRECTMLINKRPLSGECNKNIDQTVEVLTPEMLVRGYDVQTIKIIPEVEERNLDDPPFIINAATAEQKLKDSFSHLSNVQNRLKSIYYDRFIGDLLKASANSKSRYDIRNHVKLESGDFVAIKSKFVKPYAYPTGIVTDFECNDLQETTAVSIRKSNGEIIRRHVGDIILLEKNASANKINKLPSSATHELRRSPRLAAKH